MAGLTFTEFSHAQMPLQCRMAQMLTPAVDTEAAMCWEGARLIRFQAVNALSACEAKSVLVRCLQVHSDFVTQDRRQEAASMTDLWRLCVTMTWRQTKVVRSKAFNSLHQVAGNDGPEI